MNFLVILRSNLKRIFKNKQFIVITFLIPLCIALLLGFVFNKGNNVEGTSLIVNSDKGSLGSEFINEIEKNNDIEVIERDAGLEKLKRKTVSVCYEIPENFSSLISKEEKPKIITYKIESGIETNNFEFNSNSIINKMILRSELNSKNIKVTLADLSLNDSKIEVVGKENSNEDDQNILHLIISFIFFSSSVIATDLFELKRQNILERSFATGNKSSHIIGGILAAIFIFFSISFSSIFLIESFLRKSPMLDNWLVVIVNIIFMILVSLSLGIAVSRVCKSETMIIILVQIIAWITCFIGGSFAPLEFLPQTVRFFSKFTPQYWAIQSIETGNIYISGIVLLFALVLFTAGTFKSRKFI